MKTIKNTLSSILLFGLAIIVMSCQKQQTGLTELQKSQIVDSTRVILQSVIENSNKLDFTAALQFYSGDSDARYIENGAVFSSLDALKEASKEFAPSLDLIENTVDTWDIVVLGKDAVSFTLPIHIRVKAKDLPEYNGQYVYSGVVQKRSGKWMIVQTHESWLNYAEFIAALTPPSTN